MKAKISSPRRAYCRLGRTPSAARSLPACERRSGRPCLCAALWGALCLVLLGLNGCGGLALSGGSIPIGNGPKASIAAMLPLSDGHPVTGASVVVRALPSNAVLLTTTTNASGAFTTTELPIGGPLEVVVSQEDGATFKAITLPASALGTPTPKTLNIGTLSVESTVTAASLELEIAARPQDTTTIVTTQLTPLTGVALYALSGGGTSEGQSVLLTDNTLLQQYAKKIILDTVSLELDTLNAQRSIANASAALDGLLGYESVVHGVFVVLTTGQREQFITAEVQGVSYTPVQVVQALQAAGKPDADVSAVLAVSTAERATLPALAAAGTGISPFEALLIATDSSDGSGFHLDQKGLALFLKRLQQ